MECVSFLYGEGFFFYHFRFVFMRSPHYCCEFYSYFRFFFSSIFIPSSAPSLLLYIMLYVSVRKFTTQPPPLPFPHSVRKSCAGAIVSGCGFMGVCTVHVYGSIYVYNVSMYGMYTYYYIIMIEKSKYCLHFILCKIKFKII